VKRLKADVLCGAFSIMLSKKTVVCRITNNSNPNNSSVLLLAALFKVSFVLGCAQIRKWMAVVINLIWDLGFVWSKISIRTIFASGCVGVVMHLTGDKKKLELEHLACQLFYAMLLAKTQVNIFVIIWAQWSDFALMCLHAWRVSVWISKLRIFMVRKKKRWRFLVRNLTEKNTATLHTLKDEPAEERLLQSLNRIFRE